MKIAFYSNQLCLRGTEIALYSYADYNEKLLGNESIIVSQPSRDLTALPKFKNRFNVHLTEFWGIHDLVKKEKVEWVYIIKAGNNDGYSTTNVPCFIHTVFGNNEPHGDRYVYVSDWLAKSQGYDPKTHSLPHIVEKLPSTGKNMREALNIPKSAIVFGCYGGSTEFNMHDAYEAIKTTVKNRNDVYFIFMNINKFCDEHLQIIHLPGSWNLETKAEFIDTCDAMLHARRGGETFGCAVAEFSIQNKPVVTYGLSGERSHIEILGDRGIYFNGYEDLLDIVNNLKSYVKHDDYYLAYKNCAPEVIMEKFNHLINNSQ